MARAHHGLLFALAWPLACNGTIGESSQPASGVAPSASSTGAHDTAPGQFACDESTIPPQASLRRLTMTQFENTIGSLAGWSLGDPAAGSAVVQSLADVLATLPEDHREPVPEDPHGSYRRLDQSLQQEHVEGFYAVGVAVGNALTMPDRIAKVVGSCSTDNDASNDGACLDGFIQRFGSRALRRAITADDVVFYRSIYGVSAVADPLAYADVIAVMLNTPEFLYFVEHGDEPVAGQAGVFRVSPTELASRLSYQFLQTMPDDTLWSTATSRALGEPDTYRREVDRVFADAASRTTIGEFVADWLKVDDLPAMDAHNQDLVFRAFAGADLPGSDLRQHMIDDVMSMVDFMVWSRHGSMDDLLTTGLSFHRSGDLARIYGLPAWDGTANPPAFGEGQRPGLLTRALFLASGSANTRPISKGVFVRRGVLCDDLPPPPPGVNAVPPELRSDMTTRQVVEELTEKAGTVCVACHKTMINPLGFATEGFDALGRFRTSQRLYDAQGNDTGSKPVDTTSVPRVLPDDPSESRTPRDLASLIVKSGKANVCLARNYFRFTFARWEDVTRDACTLEDMRQRLENGGAVVDMLKQAALSEAFARRAFE